MSVPRKLTDKEIHDVAHVLGERMIPIRGDAARRLNYVEARLTDAEWLMRGPVRAGQVWRECDNRFVRDVLILRVGSNKAMIRGILSGRTTRAMLCRFRNVDGVSGGYRLIRW